MYEALDSSAEGLQVIALVASAGGLAAVSEVLDGLPADLDAAVIVLIHQEPKRENALVDLLARRCSLPVVAAHDHTALRAGQVVVAPPGKHVLIAAGPTLAVVASGAAPPSRPSADLLLATLATACGPRATAVVLSGEGHDGATGATAVHHLGGTVLASSERTSEHFSMPRATIERDSTIDKIVPLGDIAALLASIVAAPREPAGSEWREASADRREHIANERDTIADERERLADARDRAADEREELADEREGTAERREVERRERADAADERERQAQRREQAQINREIAATGREVARDARNEEAAQDGAGPDSEHEGN
jgi:two-component system, chemotaxis family, protein-glutamate methylesterase/glutaminase